MTSLGDGRRAGAGAMQWTQRIRSLTCVAFAIAIHHNIGHASAQDTCTFDGIMYNRGDKVDVESRCGRPDLYPCFCNPDLQASQDSLECPICTVADGGTDLRCYVDQQTISYFDVNNVGTTCTCDTSVPGVNTQNCVADPNAGVCEEENPANGQIEIRNPGEPFKYLGDSRCGTAQEFPCICDPKYPGKIACPYCAVAMPGGQLRCIRGGETERFMTLAANDLQDCSCDVPEPFNVPITTCGTAPTPAPAFDQTCEITTPSGATIEYQAGASLGNAFDNGCGREYPCFCNPNLDSQIECPYCAFTDSDGSAKCAADNEAFLYSIPTSSQPVQCKCLVQGELTADMKTIFDCDDDFQPPPILSCLSQLDSGEIVATANMASFGDLVVGPCGPPGEFPAFCNKSIPNEKEYPYCQFESQSDGTVCAKNGETLEFVDTDGDTQSCECKYTSIAVGPQAACKLVASASDAPVMSPTVVPERPPTSAPFERTTVDNRDSAASHLGVAVSWMSAASLFVVGVLAAFC